MKSNKYIYIYEDDIASSFKIYSYVILTNSEWNSLYNLIFVNNISQADIAIRLMDRKVLDYLLYQNGNQFEFYPDGRRIYFSATDVSTNPIMIYIDNINWMYGVPETNLSLNDYRTYILNHELGHSLGKTDLQCNQFTSENCTCPVMYQSTRGCSEYNCGIEPNKIDLEQ
jgi:predicted Zn-dependent protease